jgi:FkbM family methyltransferase
VLARVRNRYFRELETDLRYRVRSAITRPAAVDVAGVKLGTTSPLVTSKIRRLIYRGSYEGAEMRLVHRHLKADDQVLELGAGLGAVGTLCALMIGSHRVATVEANPTLEPVIRETHRLNDVSPTLLVAMVDSEEGEGTFYVHPEFHGSSAIQRTDAAKAITVQKVSLPSLLARYRPTFLIADVEGHEQQIFRDVDLGPIRKICLELHPHIIGDRACNEVIDRLRAQGFTMTIDDIGERNFFFKRQAA